MRAITTILFILFSLNIMAKNTVSEKPFYGERINSKTAIPLETVLKEYPKYENKNIVMKAAIDKVCTSKGCWMTLKGTESQFRVKFQDYKFFVPLSLIGKNVWVDGIISRKEISIEDTRHYLEDTGASKEKIASITKASFEYQFMAKGVVIVK
jgi:hypothetical protein